MALIWSITPLEPLFHTARHSVQVVWMSVMQRLQAKSPASELPQ